MIAPSIPPSTQAQLASPAPTGQRHAQIVRVATALISQGFNAEAVFWQIRPNYASDIPDSEIRSVINWAFSRIDNRNGTRFQNRPLTRKTPVFPNVQNGSKALTAPFRLRFSQTLAHSEIAPENTIKRYLCGFTCAECDLWEHSPIRLNTDWKTDALTVIEALFRTGETVNIVSRFAVNGTKAHPIGYGLSQTREKWLAEITRNGAPQSAAGAWIRPNPTTGTGVSDTDVTAHRLLLVEFDTVPLPLQIAFLARISLPIAAIITSGGKSLHAWIQVNAPDATTYGEIANRIFTALERFGIDTANRNPARLSRLPGVTREIGSVSDNRQRLLYLNPSPKTERIIA